MKSSAARIAAFVVATFTLLLVATSPASATTFCVPDFSAVCPNNGTNVKQVDLQVAMGQNGSDGLADTIYMGAYTYTDLVTLNAPGTDDLNLIGTGTATSFITSALVGGNNFVVNLNSGSRKVNMSNLTIVVPASFADNNGAGIQARDGVFDHVNIESRNPRSEGAPSLIGNVVWKNSRIYGAAGGSIDFGLETNNNGPSATLQVINTTIEDSIWAIEAADPTVSVDVKRSHFIKPVGYGIIGNGGALISVENSIFEIGNQAGIKADSLAGVGAKNLNVSVKNSTFIAGANLATPAIEIEIKGSHDSTVTVADSILQGFQNSWKIQAAAGPGIGHASLTLTDSNFNPVGLPDESPVVNTSDAGNINVTPSFVSSTDFHLAAGSPSIDAGDPAAGGVLEDFDGNVRPLDGNGDGTRVRDQGAYEAAEIPTCANTPSLCPPPPDTTAPALSKLKFKSPGKKAGSLSVKVSEAATVTATFKPKPKRQKGKKLKSLKLIRTAKAGTVKFTIRKGKLKPGKYMVTVVAKDPSGNSSKPLKKRVTVKG